MHTPITTTIRDSYIDWDTADVLDEPLASSGTLRIPLEWLGDGGAEIQLLASLMKEIELRLPKSVALARELVGRDGRSAWHHPSSRLAAVRAPRPDHQQEDPEGAIGQP